MARSVLLTFATPNFEAQRQCLVADAKAVGFDEVVQATWQSVAETEFGRRHAALLSAPRGAGYWLWKPWLIQQTLQQLAPDDLLVYSDAGRSRYYRMSRFPSALVRTMDAAGQGILLGPKLWQHGPIGKWTHGRCLKAMGVGLQDPVLDQPTIQATWSLWRNTPQARQFVQTWLAWCEKPECLTDLVPGEGQECRPDFVDHRHDQSILSILCYQAGIPALDFKSRWFMKVMMGRPTMQISNLFLKAIDDAEVALRDASGMIFLESFFRARRFGY